MADEDPEIRAQIDRLWARVLATLQANKLQFDDQLLRLLGLMFVEFNALERDFKYLLMLLRDDLPLGEAQKTALKIKTFAELLKEVKPRFHQKFSDPSLIEEFTEIVHEADDLRKERNLMLHSVWHTTSDPEKPFVRVKEDEDEPELDFDFPTVKKLVDRMIGCKTRAYNFFCDKLPGYPEIVPRLYDSKEV